MYTAKLVKTILINTVDKLVEHFKPSRSPEPKLVHVSPLYSRSSRGGTKCVYSYAVCKTKHDIIKCQGSPQPIILEGGYHFYFGFCSRVISPAELMSALVEHSNTCMDFMSQRVCIEVERVDIYNSYSLSLEIAKKVLEAGGLKVIFSSPTLLRDPLRPMGKFKSYFPTPFNVFGVPVYVRLYTKGQYTVRKLRTELLKLHRLFNETYSALGGIKVKWVYYSSRPEPALIGYVNYRVNGEYFNFLKQKGFNVEEWLAEIFAYALTLGVGAGRAAGFGHVVITPLGRGKEK